MRRQTGETFRLIKRGVDAEQQISWRVIDVTTSTASKRRPGASASKPSAEPDIAKKSLLTRRQRGSAVSCLPSGSKPRSCHSYHFGQWHRPPINDRTPEFSSTACAV